jgi:hypothetical protein
METNNRMPYLSLGASLRKRILVNAAGVFFILIAAVFISLDLFMHTEAKAADKVQCKEACCKEAPGAMHKTP